MKNLELYSISFKGLSSGSHVFDWKIDDSFFAMYEMSEISEASIDAQVALTKRSDFLELDFALNGWVEVVCDRCLDPLRLEMTTEAKMYVTFGERAGEDDADDIDVIVLPYGEHQVNVAQYLYEYAHLNLPIRRVHAEKNDCNAEMIKKLEEYLVEN